jgi:hypothetical protein
MGFRFPDIVWNNPIDGDWLGIKDGAPEDASISVIYYLFPILHESHDLIFIYSPRIRDFNQ